MESIRRNLGILKADILKISTVIVASVGKKYDFIAHSFS
jgi:hypothetical protein